MVHPDDPGIHAARTAGHGETETPVRIALWYYLHRQNGGAPDQVAERIVAEVVAREDSTVPYRQDGSTRIH